LVFAIVSPKFIFKLYL